MADAKLVRMRGECAMSVSKSTCFGSKDTRKLLRTGNKTENILFITRGLTLDYFVSIISVSLKYTSVCGQAVERFATPQ